MDEITWKKDCETILTKLQEFLKMVEDVMEDMPLLDIDILHEIVAVVIQWTETTL